MAPRASRRAARQRVTGHRILVASAAFIVPVSCGGNVVVDARPSSGGGGARATSSSSAGGSNLCELVEEALMAGSSCAKCHGNVCDITQHCGTQAHDCVNGWVCVGQCNEDGSCIAKCIEGNPGLYLWVECVGMHCAGVCSGTGPPLACPLGDAG
jgi:hypothetical protein